MSVYWWRRARRALPVPVPVLSMQSAGVLSKSYPLLLSLLCMHMCTSLYESWKTMIICNNIGEKAGWVKKVGLKPFWIRNAIAEVVRGFNLEASTWELGVMETYQRSAFAVQSLSKWKVRNGRDFREGFSAPLETPGSQHPQSTWLTTL